MATEYITKMSAQSRAQLITNYSNTLLGVNGFGDNSVFLNKLARQWRYNLDLFENFRYRSGSGYYISGRNGEQLYVPINHFRSVILTKHSLSWAPVGLKASAMQGADSSINAEVTKADNFLDYIRRFKGLDDAADSAGLIGDITGTGLLFVDFDSDEGPIESIMMPEMIDGLSPDQQIMKSVPIPAGDFVFRELLPNQVYAPAVFDDWSRVPYCIVTTLESKCKWAARSPENAEKIENWSGPIFNMCFSPFSNIANLNPDAIPVRRYYHISIPGMLDRGQHTIVLGDDIVLFDGDNPHATGDGSQMPVFVYRPIKWAGTWYGQTVANDLAPIQFAYDLTSSCMATNIAHHGVPNLYSSYAGLDPTTLTNGAQHYYFPEGTAPPQVMDLLPDPTRLLNNQTYLEKQFSLVASLDEGSRGQVPENVKSGVMYSLMLSQSVQACSSAIKSKIKFYEDIGNFVLKLAKEKIKTPRVIAIQGKDGSTRFGEFSGSDLGSIQAVFAEAEDPMQNTAAGKYAKAEVMNQSGLGDPYDAGYVIDNGKLPKSYFAKSKEEALAENENERLREGKIVQVLPMDDPVVHIATHKEIFNDPQLRDDFVTNTEPGASVYQNAMSHLQAHQMQMAPMMAPPPGPGPAGGANPAAGGAHASPKANGGPPQAVPPMGMAPPIPPAMPAQ